MASSSPSRSIAEGSCFNCRAKKVRCDRLLPRCSPCHLRGLTCATPAAPPRMLWLRPWTMSCADGDSHPVDGTHARRQPLFRGDQQAQDAADLVSLLSRPTSSIAPLIEEIDCHAEAIHGDEMIVKGPFHVFRHECVQGISSTMSSSLPDLDVFPSISDAIAQDLDEEDILQLPWTPASPPTPKEQTNVNETRRQNAQMANIQPSLPVLEEERLCSPHPLELTIPMPRVPDLDDFSMTTAKSLLHHYQKMMVPFHTPARVNRKTPWEILYIPNVLSTIGEIMLTGNSGNAKVALLFALFAVSAFSLDSLRTHGQHLEAKDWRCLGEIYREKATVRLKLSLRNLSIARSKKEKYKEILMPLLSMVTICVVSGDMKNATHYLQDLEKIISRHGIPKVRKSRKVQMLHSIYLYLRVLTESTNINNTSSSSSTGDDIVSCNRIPPWDQLLRDSSHTYDLLDLDFMQSLSPPRSPFEEIYSFPESLFKLILRTTQLAGDVEKLRIYQRARNTDHDAFASAVKDLENSICEWEYQQSPDPLAPDGSASLPSRETFPYHLVQAVHSALFIYFYRCVRDVNAVMLQPYVHQTIHHLLEYDKQKERHKDQSANTCWPGFIAGCEATQLQARRQVSEWLEQSARSSGIRMFTVALKAVRKVWNARSVSGDHNLPWGSILREFSDLRVLVLS
ncbi:hypothetical protein FE257_009839 [Aspergillus nanangensis]|uniref:Zn(2)-C6 fungal-type domain-containing protein n=1 Tax=Aspergillus nanangensis TaxID=2582783 RepID=A0AAD4CVW6_ASPNN|nr:hypothetical protein FE257_009839 [Aspergillus nanangensis]